MLFNLLFFVITISVVVVFHELGHYLAARFYNVRVERFSLGFGKVLFRKTDKHGTEWVLSALPLGGYVKPLAEPPAGASIKEAARAISQKTAWQRFVIFAAGPFFSFLLAIIIYSGMKISGTTEPVPYLSQPAANTLAYTVGIEGGDKVLAVDGNEVQGWAEVRLALLEPLATGAESTLVLQGVNGATRNITMHFPKVTGTLEGVDLMGQAGLALMAPQPVVANVLEDGAGEQAGLKKGDLVLRAGTQDDVTITGLIKLIQDNPSQTIPLLIARDNTELSVNITPRAEIDANDKTVGKIGVAFTGQYPTVTVRYGIFESIYLATVQTFDTAWFSLKMLGKMVMGQLSWKNISGPIAIADYAGQSAQVGMDKFIEFIALITVSIGVLNLIPIPGLDGGQMVFCLIEMVRKKALSETIQEKSLMVGYSLLLFLMIFAFVNDIARVL
ncbi:RIP metalloprotease RseP [Advenella sp. RU8]|uniref:RIP metalloprotease RseP n=1 Tax=Advenella sp. RU8 TaxID=3399575 RepID=UPI003AAFA1B9